MKIAPIAHAVFEVDTVAVVFIAQLVVEVPELVRRSQTAAAGGNSTVGALEKVVIKTDIHFAALDFDAVIVGVGKNVAVDVGVSAETAVDLAVSGAFNGVVPPFQVAAHKVVEADNSSPFGLVHKDGFRAGGVRIEPAV